ncbi:unnamed protein product [Didymodactylos carnosus]|uniref:Uncharacterized protein n=1 Tax=Didymodactylos carnosus TaxID=1234261 RepID=A0A815GUH7_9BILA|nr:unnamed protein product [Didymodactylos carnosus]CAF4204777.1 unnamed protein product [Didymodactylos carnosus]
MGDRQGGNLLLIDYRLAERQLDNKQLQIGEQKINRVFYLYEYLILAEETRKLLPQLSKEEREISFKHVRIIYHTIADYMRTYLPLNNSFLCDVQASDHSRCAEPNTIDPVLRLARAVPGLLSLNEVDLLRDKCLSYSIETIDQS